MRVMEGEKRRRGRSLIGPRVQKRSREISQSQPEPRMAGSSVKRVRKVPSAAQTPDSEG